MGRRLEAGMMAGGPSLSDQTARMVVHTNVARRKVRCSVGVAGALCRR